MKIHWYTLTWNEEDIAPFILQYWQKLIDDGVDLYVYIWDNYSTDSTIDILKQKPWIEVRLFQTDGMNDVIHATIKNNCWKEAKGKADWVVLADFDEILWSNDFVSELQYMKDNGYNMLGTKWYAFCGDSFPTFSEEKYLHQLVKRGYKQYINHMPQYSDLGKFMLFNPNTIDSLQFSVGNHILYNIKPYLKLYKSDKIIAFHVNKGLGEDYFVNRRKLMAKRLSETNKKYGMSIEYLDADEKMRNEYKNNVNNSIDISNL